VANKVYVKLLKQGAEAWARKLHDSRNIGDFCGWKDHDACQKALNRLLRDLRIETA
jgi:hypothetical protein